MLSRSRDPGGDETPGVAFLPVDAEVGPRVQVTLAASSTVSSSAVAVGASSSVPAGYLRGRSDCMEGGEPESPPSAKAPPDSLGLFPVNTLPAVLQNSYSFFFFAVVVHAVVLLLCRRAPSMPSCSFYAVVLSLCLRAPFLPSSSVVPRFPTLPRAPSAALQ